MMALAARGLPRPKAIVLHSMANDTSWRMTAELRALCADMGLPLFLSMRGAATAIRRLIDYHRAHPGWKPRPETGDSVAVRIRSRKACDEHAETGSGIGGLLPGPPSDQRDAAPPDPTAA
jgi:hypothetical protein